MKLSKGAIATIIILGVLIIDQIVKIWVKTHMYLGQEFVITDWFRIYFIENNGMARYGAWAASCFSQCSVL